MRKCDYPLLCNRFSTLLRFSRVLTTIACLSRCQEGDTTSTKLFSSSRLNDNRLLLQYTRYFVLWKTFFFSRPWRRRKANWNYNHVVQPTAVGLFGNNKKRSLNNTHVHNSLKYIARQTWNAFTKFLILFVVMEDLKLQSHGLWWKQSGMCSKYRFEDVSITTCAWKRWLEL